MALGTGDEAGNGRVMICPNSLNVTHRNVSDGGRELCQLRHPRTNKAASFICSEDAAYEVNHFKPKTSCWFIGETIRSDGTLLVVTPVDPLFLVLPYVFRASQSSNGKKFMLLDQILVDEDFAAVEKCLLPVISSKSWVGQLHHVADVKTIEDSDSPAVRFNETKALDWLERKTRALSAELKAKNVDIHGSRCASLIVTNVVDNGIDVKNNAEEKISPDLLRYAHDVLGEYLSYSLKLKLTKHLKIDADDASTCQSASSHQAPPVAKKAKMAGADEPLEDYTKATATPFSPAPANKKTKAAKDLAKASKGTASLMTFFKATPKK